MEEEAVGVELAWVKWRRQVEQPPFLSGCCSVGGTAVLLQHTVDLIGIVRSALLLLFHHRSAVSVSSMESLHCLRGRIRLTQVDGARSLPLQKTLDHV